MKRSTSTTARPAAPGAGEPRASVRLVRCAIYTRKSTEEGLEQEFNSLDTQREAGEAYVASQQHEAGAACPTVTTMAASAGATPTGPPCGG